MEQQKFSFNQFPTPSGYTAGLVSSALQKCIRRGIWEDAAWWALELYHSGYGKYAFKRMKIMCSEDIGPANATLPATLHALEQMYLEQEKKKDTRHRPERLFLVHAAILLAQSPKSRLIDWKLVELQEKRKAGWKGPDVIDAAYDIHTHEGRQMGRKLVDFYEEGSILHPHDEQPREAELKAECRRLTVENSSELF